MKVGIILHPYNEKKPAGLGGYILELTKNLIEEDEENEYIIYIKENLTPTPKVSHFGGQATLSLKRRGRINWRFHSLGFGQLWRDLGLWLAPKADVYIFNTPVIPLFFRPKRSIVIALDFAYLYKLSLTPRLRQGYGGQATLSLLNNLLLFHLNKFSSRKADKIVAISEAAKNDVIKFFGIKPEKISVIYPGFRDMGEIEAKELPIIKPFFLYVGVIKERKNVLNIVKAFIEFKKSDANYANKHTNDTNKNNYKLVVAGKGGGEYLEQIKNLIRQEKMESEIIFSDYVDINQLAWLYKNAEALVFPSLIEGFGFPLLEAMSAGLPVITSKTSSLGEVANDAALLVDPLDIHEISEAMNKIIRDENLRQELIKKGYERAGDFSWKKCAKEFLQAFKF